jgi:hypothetical protein
MFRKDDCMMPKDFFRPEMICAALKIYLQARIF